MFLLLILLYAIIGLCVNFLIFLWAKIKNLGEKNQQWEYILNNLAGFFYFMLLGCVLWLPILTALYLESKRDLSYLSWLNRLISLYHSFVRRKQ